jgi:glycosyltransferase involved in cell wall biosynthesis
MDSKIDVIIATYNRIGNASNLALNLIEVGNEYIKNVILVDSTDNQERLFLKSEKIIHLLSKHKNQPYQRFLGYKYSSADIVLFLDDDMEILNKDFIKDLSIFFEKESYCGLNIPFDNINEFVTSQPISIAKTNNKFLDKIRGVITGYPTANENDYLHCGIKGSRTNNKEIKFFSGGAFAVKSRNLYDNFNMQHFDLYETKLGMGEDGLLGFSFSINNKIWAWEKVYLVHNDLKNSTYGVNLINSSKRYLYSRLNLNYEYYRLKNKKSTYPRLSYYHFAIFRILSALFVFIFKNKKSGQEIFIGYINAVKLSFKYKYKRNLSANLKWYKNAEAELLDNSVFIVEKYV